MALDMLFDRFNELLTQAPDGNDITILLQRLDHDYDFGRISTTEAEIGEFDFNADLQENGDTYLQTLWDSIHRVPANTRRLVFSCMDRLAQHPVMRGYFVEHHMVDMLNILMREGGQTVDEEFFTAKILHKCASDREIDLFIDPTGNDRMPHAFIRHADAGNEETDMGYHAFEEELMLLSGIYLDYPEKTEEYMPHLDIVVDVLNDVEIPERPLDRPVASLIHCLTRLINIPTGYAELPIWGDIDARKLLQIMEAAIDFYDRTHRNIHMERLLQLLFLVNRFGAAGDQNILRGQLIPTFMERREMLGSGTTLVHKMVCAVVRGTNRARASFGHLMMALSNFEVHQLVFNYGYFCAVEILFVLRIPIPTMEMVQDSFAQRGYPRALEEYDTLTGQLVQEMYVVPDDWIARSQQIVRVVWLLHAQAQAGEATGDNEDANSDAETIILPENQPAAVAEGQDQEEEGTGSEASTVILAKNQPAAAQAQDEDENEDEDEDEGTETDRDQWTDLDLGSEVELELDTDME